MYLLFVALICLFLYYYTTKNHDYWKKKGVKHDKPIPLFGNNFRQFFQMASMTQMATEMYWKYPNERFVGFYRATRPELVIRDPELVKAILVTDFAHFYPRGLNPHKTVIEPLLKNLFFADGDLWRLLRQRLTPAFTSGKLKAMFPMIVERAEKLQEIALETASTGKTINIRELMARYTTDFIGACGFGIEADSLNDENSTFRKLGKRIFHISTKQALTNLLKFCYPEIFKHLEYFPPEMKESVLHLMKTVMEQRNYKPSGRNDFIDLLLELKEKGKIVGESIERNNPDGSPRQVDLELDDMLMASQVFVFFGAGFETSSSSTSFTLHQLAFHPEEQKKVQQNIDEVLKKYDNKLCYDAVKEMQYLEMAFYESMRMFPSLGFLIRTCAKKYKIPDSNVTIDEDVSVFIPVQAMHTDEKYFEEPHKFKPERFHPNAAKNIKKHVYLPFGEGPRACIGERLGLMQSMAGMAALLHKFSVEPAEESLKNPIVDPNATLVQYIKNGLPLKLVARS
ncbi:Cytochrome P450 6B2 [Eumeta japonica]|uniref:unspecific monooxygenase n=1 Tax=Eumeta variegata TaxID=151549 RepID=A0A4C1V8E9_EUMVA|nr:Cytochrome P450 6B2 [Eumeta japonica]